MEENRNRTRIFLGLIGVILGVLVLRLAELQLIDSSSYYGESRSNASRLERILPARGAIYDRNSRLMVDNEPAYSILVTPLYWDSSRVSLLSSLLGLPDSTITSRVNRARSWSFFRPSLIERGVTFDVLARIEENKRRLPGISYEVDQRRKYLTNARASHVLGYVRQISEADLSSQRREGYQAGDLIGQMGIERSLETRMRGLLGRKISLVNVRGQRVESWMGGKEDIPPESGYNVELTIDSELQAFAESLFLNKRGALVALDPRDGEIISMVSAPDYDLSELTSKISPERWRYLTSSEEKPIFNRATSSRLMPGSTLKPFIALMALQEGAITPGETYYCPGGHPRGHGKTMMCLAKHGNIAVKDAIRESCNTFFFEMMRRIDVNTFSRYARGFGFGTKVPIDIAEQDTGLVPDSSYFNRVYGRRGWNVGTPMNLGVGQGDLGVTPLQLARYVAAVANGGKLVTPHLVRELRRPGTGEVVRGNWSSTETIRVNPRYFDIVRRGMEEVIEEKDTWLIMKGIRSAGKTGTAQNTRGEDDSVFIMYAPAEDPVIAIAAVVENAGYGSTAAGPVASLVAEKYLTGTTQRAWLLDMALKRASDPLPSRRKVVLNP
jgi:penicillin-binding protein 2